MSIYQRFIEGHCHVCSEIKAITHHEIYHIGSEGLDICQECELKVIDFIRSMQRERVRHRKTRESRITVFSKSLDNCKDEIYFFSTSRLQNVDKSFDPTSFFGRSKEYIRENYFKNGIEISNPDKKYQA